MICIGKIVSTHGIKGELKILSNFEYKDKVFLVGKKLIIDDKEYKIRTYRKHKNFDMVTLNDYNNINDVLHLLQKKVYFLKEDLVLDNDEVLDEELLTYQVISLDGKIGKVEEIFFASPTNKILRIFLDREILVPFHSPMLVKIDKKNKQIVVNIIDGI